MKNPDSHDTRRCRRQRQFDRDQDLDDIYSHQQRLELRRHYSNVLRDVDPDAAEWAEYFDENWLP